MNIFITGEGSKNVLEVTWYRSELGYVSTLVSHVQKIAAIL